MRAAPRRASQQLVRALVFSPRCCAARSSSPLRAEHARRAAAAALATVTEDLASAVNDGARRSPNTQRSSVRVADAAPAGPGVADVFNNQRVIEAEARELQARGASAAAG